MVCRRTASSIRFVGDGVWIPLLLDLLLVAATRSRVRATSLVRGSIVQRLQWLPIQEPGDNFTALRKALILESQSDSW